MSHYKIKITLLSDLCVSDGGVYNSALDLDICYDTHGLVCIPAKRLKGCLRESALELNDWDDQIDIAFLFGGKGNYKNAGILNLSDARLSDAEGMIAEIEENPSILYHPQNVLNHFSYIRTQTSIDNETGVAKDQSLRTMRVANKGLTFEAKLTVADAGKSSEEIQQIKKQLADICANLTEMGNARTRGLGEVRVTLEESDHQVKAVQQASCQEQAEVLKYEFILEEPIICKGVSGGEANSQDYIEGNKLLGLVAGRYRSEKNREITELFEQGDMVFSNAYIMDGEIRYTEVPKYVYGIKNWKKTYINKLYDLDNQAASKDGQSRQLNGMKHCYVTVDADGTLQKKDVRIEQRYHHRRPADKSIGRAAAEASGDSMFYQLSSIAAGQRFGGFIKGSAQQIQTIYELLRQDENARIGYGKSSEYGKIRMIKLETANVNEKEVSTDKLLVTLISPAIVYNDRAFYSTDCQDLAYEVLAELGIDEKQFDQIEQKYVGYTKVGGYNVTWDMRKPTMTAFDKGTALVIRLKEAQNIKISNLCVIGERRIEGYGEVRIAAFEQQSEAEFAICKESAVKMGDADGKIIDVTKYQLAAAIAQDLFETYLQDKCVDYAKDYQSEAYRATVSNLMIMCEENDSYDQIKQEAMLRYKDKKGQEKKYEYAKKLLKIVDDSMDQVLEDFADQYHLIGFVPKGDKKKQMLHELLIQVKYMIRYASRKNEKKGEAK